MAAITIANNQAEIVSDPTSATSSSKKSAKMSPANDRSKRSLKFNKIVKYLKSKVCVC